MRPILLGGPAGTRRVAPAELPLRIGRGARVDIRVPGALDEAVLGLVSLLDDRPLLQRLADEPLLAVNGEPCTATRWLADGDVVTVETLRLECHFDAEAWRFTVAYTDTEYPTLPPAALREATVPAPRAAPATRPAGAARRRAWPVWALLAVLLGVALSLFTARSVGVVVTPAGADLRLHGGLPVRLAGRYLLWPGRYALEASAPGYVTRTEPLQVGDAPRQEVRIVLQQLPGRVALRPQPAVPLTVAVDGAPRAPAADGAWELAAGAHRLAVTARRYQPLELAVNVEGGGVRQEVPLALLPNWADVSVASDPAGAAVFVDGEALGTTPAVVPVEAGARTIELRREGYKTWRQALTAEAGHPQRLPMAVLEESDALLALATEPAGATVTVDGRYRGVTPVEVDVTPGRRHEVVLVRPGFETVTRPVEVARRGRESLRVTLVPRTGTVRVRAEPADAELVVDGASRGPANQELALPAVKHRLEVRRAGYASWSEEVLPEPGLPKVFEVRLLTPQQAIVAATPRTATTAQGAVLRRVEPGQFTMGAPRREQGRRPNEVEHAVKLTRPYFIGVKEVTNREFREFRPTHTSGAEKYAELSGTDHPAVMLSWEDAAAYCNWLSDRDHLPHAYASIAGKLQLESPVRTGYRLPTEAEWEWAARYSGGGGARRFPWGDDLPPPPDAGNYADESARTLLPNVLAGYNDGYVVTAPVGKFAPSPLGLYDLGGNAAEWTTDAYTIADTGPAVAVDPVGAGIGPYHVIRGSSWRHASITELRFAYRDFGDQGRLDVGFRIARYAE